MVLPPTYCSSLLCDSLPREYRVQEGKVVFPLGVSVHGDVVLSVSHMRSTIGGRLQAKVLEKATHIARDCLCETVSFDIFKDQLKRPFVTIHGASSAKHSDGGRSLICLCL